MSRSILLVDDDAGIQASFSKFLTRSGYVTQAASTLGEARLLFLKQRFDAVLLDMNLPDGNGMDLISEFRERSPSVALVVITALGDVPMAVDAMRRGADNFLTKPVHLEDLGVFLRKSLEVGMLRRESLARRRTQSTPETYFGESEAIQSVMSYLRTATESSSPVLLMGETGTGKGVFARWIHQHSRVAEMPFVDVSCSSLRGELLSSELFGHARGSFTSAVENRPGLLDIADGGTLFLDEIGDMDLSLQSQFLKLLEEKRYRRLGEVQDRSSDFRLICASNRNMLEETRNGRFRQDLYFRINVFPIEIPPLRARKEDLAGLIRHLMNLMGAPDVEIAPDAMQALLQYNWPGNVREMKNLLERGLLLSKRRTLEKAHFSGLDASGLLKATHSDLREKGLPDFERAQEALRRAEGDKNKAAEFLGVSRATFYRMVKRVH